MQSFTSSEENVANTLFSFLRRPSFAEAISITAILSGVGVIVWGLFFMNPSLPAQEKAFEIPSSPIPTETELPIPEPYVPEPVLYLARPKIGSKIGSIALPTLKQNWPVYEGASESELRRGVGHYRNSVLPGMSDNTVLSGHRTTVFNKLGKLKKGDLVHVKTKAGVFTYKVRSHRVVKKTDKTVIVPTDTGVLTLTTCYPFNYVGTTTKAYIVVSDLVESKLTKQ